MRRIALISLCVTVTACSGGGAASSTPPQSANAAAASSSGTRLIASSGVARRPDAASSCSGTGQNSFIGGGNQNVADNLDAAVLAGQTNVVCDVASSIGGGDYNLISSGRYSWIGSGDSNTITNSGFSAIDSGNGNVVSAGFDFIGTGAGNAVSGDYSSVVGGENNTASAQLASIGGGVQNTAGGEFGTVAGGQGNSVSAEWATVAGGNTNTASGNASNVAGGANNVASGQHATVLGGSRNTASGNQSLAAGVGSTAATAGSFVWSDDAANATALTSTVANQFLARATGGFTLWTNATNTVGATLAPGSGAWASASDRNLKTDVVALDDAQVLDRVGRLPVSAWSYKTEGGVRHIGPMAQDFYAAFGVGADDRHITSIDEDGVALAAIKALRERDRVLRAQNAALREHEAATDRRVARLEALVRELASHAGG